MADMEAAGFSPTDLKAADSSLAVLIVAGCSAADLEVAGFSLDALKAGFTLAVIKAAGFSATDRKAADISLADISLGALALPG